MIIDYQYKADKLRGSIKALINKKMIPERSYGYFDLDKLDSFLHYHEKQEFKEWSCTTCGITVYGLKKMLIEHHKIHSDPKMKENEIYQKDYKLY